MAANIEQIFQDFILKKIREIEEQKEERGSEAAGPDCEAKLHDAAKKSLQRNQDQGPSESQRRQKKHKKHKSKKKRNHEKESSSESGAEMEGKMKHQPRKGTLASEMKEQGEDHGRKSRSHREHSSGKKKKKKKKKKRRRSEENTSDSDSEIVSKQKVTERLRPRQEQLPDIIPKQVIVIQANSKSHLLKPSKGLIKCIYLGFIFLCHSIKK
ncbi:hypothetical protein XENOCAPTIV_012875 [Xenoophorus captivus]|uniref:Uncharacterized protein n=1 Tax=Xenoophorus captivus TaxID=1517983 RepID=A0ABV0R3M5_9TELE